MKPKLFLILLLLGSIQAPAQLNPLSSGYFFNPYLTNPAMCATESGAELNAALKGQWTAIDGAPVMQAVTFGYHPEGRQVAFGVAYYHEKAGVIDAASWKATYSYHLQLDGWGDNFLDLGLSVGFHTRSLDWGKIRGDLSDIQLENFGKQGTYVDGDFGFSLRVNGLHVQGAAPNMKQLLNRDTERVIADRSTYMISAGYLFEMNHPVLNILEPMVRYRGVQHYKPVLDIGVNGRLYDEKVLFNAIYHSTGSLTVGIGMTYEKRWSFMAAYTSNTSRLKNYTNGEFEAGIKYRLR